VQADISIQVSEVNASPALAPIGSKTVELGRTLTFTAQGSDVDIPVQTLTYHLSRAPAGASIDALTGAFAWTPTAAQSRATYTFDLAVSDGVTTTASPVTVTVVDTTSPSIASISASPDVLWPPNHKLVPVTISVTATDLAGTPSCRVTRVSNNETGVRDAVLVAPLELLLLAERSGRGPGRLYTIEVTCTDPSGNVVRGTTTVGVPHDRGHDDSD
jgi:hypothetical protein